jgi:hypothetical protein
LHVSGLPRRSNVSGKRARRVIVNVVLQTVALPMTESFVALVVTVPEEHFPDEDDICLTASNYVCAKLESHLVQHGHSILDWIQGGCDEDWGVYFESQRNGTTFQYHICFFPGPRDTTQNQMLIQYHVRLPFMKRLFRKPVELLPDHPIHKTMRSFGDLFSASRQLTQVQFETEY